MTDGAESDHAPTSSRPTDVLRHYLGDIVFGANDGIITTFAVVSGVTGAHLSTKVIVILGIVNLIADGFSMGASNFLAIRSEAGGAGTHRGVREPILHGLFTFAAFVLFGAVPLGIYLVPGVGADPFLWSCVATAVTLFTVGAARALVTPHPWIRCGVEMLAVGAGAAAIAYGLGRLLEGIVRG